MRYVGYHNFAYIDLCVVLLIHQLLQREKSIIWSYLMSCMLAILLCSVRSVVKYFEHTISCSSWGTMWLFIVCFRGEPKCWYGVPGAEANAFEQVYYNVVGIISVSQFHTIEYQLQYTLRNTLHSVLVQLHKHIIFAVVGTGKWS